MLRPSKLKAALGLMAALTFLWHGTAIADHPLDKGSANEASETLPDLDELGDLDDNEVSLDERPLGGSPIPDVPELSGLDDLGSTENKSDLILLITGKVTRVTGGEAKIKFKSGYSPHVGELIYFGQDHTNNTQVLAGAGVITRVGKSELWARITRGSPNAGMNATITSINPRQASSPEFEKPEIASKFPSPVERIPETELQLDPGPEKTETVSMVPTGPDRNQSSETLYETGSGYYRGEGVPPDYGKAFQWMFLAAGKGHPAAQNDVGIMYEKGKGTSKNYNEAINWYKKSAAQNYPSAHYNLGRLYDSGIGVRKNYSEALKSFRRAAQLGQKDAQARLRKQRLRW